MGRRPGEVMAEAAAEPLDPCQEARIDRQLGQPARSSRLEDEPVAALPWAQREALAASTFYGAQKGGPRPKRKQSRVAARGARAGAGGALPQDREEASGREKEANLSRRPALPPRRGPAAAGKGSG